MNPLIYAFGLDDCESNSSLPRTKHDLDLTQFEDLLDKSQNTISIGQHRRLFLIQTSFRRHDLPASSKLRDLLQTRFKAPVAVFHSQRWNQTTFRFNEIINCPRLPTTARPRTTFSLEYFELWQVVNDEFFTYHMRDANTVMCAVTGREIQCHKWSTSSAWLLITPRKCSYWTDRSDDSCDAVVICDPPPKRVIANGVQIELEITAFEGGYHGFIPDSLLGTSSENPPHTSFINDLAYYIQTHANVLQHPQAPESAAMFLRKIVASHYCQLLGFVSHQTAAMRSSGWAVQRRTQQEIDEADQVEAAWSHFKCPEYLEALSTGLDSLGISQGHDPYDVFDVSLTDLRKVEAGQQKFESPPEHSDWRSSTADFLYLHREFRLRLGDYSRMTSSLAALNGMIGGRISILEARTARTLTLVAMLFAPPACVASIFSIPSDGFGQHGPRFGWYWVAAVPLTVLVFLLTYLVHERDLVRRIWKAHQPRPHVDGINDASAKV